MKHIPSMVLLYKYEQIDYLVQLIKSLPNNKWEIQVEGLIAPKKKLSAFTRKYSILVPGTSLQVSDKDLRIDRRIIGLVIDHIKYIEYQIYLYEEDKQLEEAQKWKEYKYLFLPTVTHGGIA